MKSKPLIIDQDLQDIPKDKILELIKNYPLLYFRNQKLNFLEFEENSKKFGEPFFEEFLRKLFFKDKHFDERFKYIIPLSSSGILGKDELDWHKDNIFVKESTARLLYAESIPDNHSGNTYWANTVEIYNSLPSEIKQLLENVQVLHEYNSNKEKNVIKEDIWLSAINSFNSKKTLNLSVWMRYTPVKSVKNIDIEKFNKITSFIKNEFLDNENFIYKHKWKEGDLIFFNNQTTLHKRDIIDSQHKERLLYRITVKVDNNKGNQ